MGTRRRAGDLADQLGELAASPLEVAAAVQMRAVLDGASGESTQALREAVPSPRPAAQVTVRERARR